LKSLTQLAQDLKDMADLLRQQADELQEIIQFFGGAPASQSPPASPKKEIIPIPTPKLELVTGAAEVKVEKPVRKKPNTGSRPLSPEEKVAIKKDWESFPPALRHKENRLALSRKWKCSPVQVYQLTTPSIGGLLNKKPKSNTAQQVTLQS